MRFGLTPAAADSTATWSAAQASNHIIARGNTDAEQKQRRQQQQPQA
jgi:hypothetical protein